MKVMRHESCCGRCGASYLNRLNTLLSWGTISDVFMHSKDGMDVRWMPHLSFYEYMTVKSHTNFCGPVGLNLLCKILSWGTISIVFMHSKPGMVFWWMPRLNF